MNIQKLLLSFLFLGILGSNCFGQITPPGLGKVNTASWMAIGIKQALDSAKQVSSITYIGMGRTSSPTNDNPFKRGSIFVINQEVSNHFTEHWKYAFALSYRWQNLFNDNSTTGDHHVTQGRQEFRFYGQLSYLKSISRLKYAVTYRPEMRLFYLPDFRPYSERIQFRSRLKAKMSIDLNEASTKRLISSAEVLFSSGKHDKWEKFEYKDTRLCLYYAFSPPNSKLNFNIGYMYDLIGKSFDSDTHYLAFDIIFG
ncbi:DUF2490 domain-containing protein [Limibacter armeniacum]|uniref:DUF2490 domain-containing protein n=1 Tax=Limibacter armeniacum TaxID=466084 RepID=UPI002FE55636